MWLALHIRAFLTMNSEISAYLTNDDIAFMQDLRDRKIVWGTQKQVERLDAIENKLKQPQLAVGNTSRA